MPTTLLANRYKLIRTLGEGAMGQVLLVEEEGSFRQVALKVISRALGSTEKSVLQLKQEFRLMTQLRHPHCCEVYDYGVLDDSEPYFTMEVVPGYGLDEALPLSPTAFKHVISQLLFALNYLHQLGYVHRDLKPANVRVRHDGTVKLMDYGLIEHAGRAGTSVSGTLAYVAPEVIKRAPADRRADLYSLGCLAYELLTGQVPFARTKASEMLLAHLNDRPVPPSQLRPGLPPEFDRLVLKLLEKEPTARFQSAAEVLEAMGVEAPAAIGGSLLAAPLSGREAELERLLAALATVATGQPRPGIALQGAPGVGKSRLLEELRFRAQLDNVPYTYGPSFEQAAFPYAPWVRVLRALLPQLRAHADAALGRFAPVLVKLLPELGVSEAPGLDAPSKEKLRLHEAVVSVLGALAAVRPFVLVLDDWQWADGLSRDLLTYLQRNMREAPMLLIVASRPKSEVASDPSSLESLILESLGPDGLRRMLAAMLGTPLVDSRFCTRIAELTGGNPFYVERLLEHLVGEGTLVSRRGQWDTGVEIDITRLPDNLQGLLASKITALSPVAQRIARVAAVIGREVRLDLLRRTLVVEESEFLEGLLMLRGAGLLVQKDEGVFLFSQDQFQQLLHSTMDAEERACLHTMVAEAMEDGLDISHLAEVPAERVAAIARHYLQGMIPAKSIAYALEAGMRYAAMFAQEDAESFLTAGLALLHEETGGRTALPNRYLKLDYLRTLGDVYRGAMRMEDAAQLYDEAATLAQSLGEDRTLGRILTSLAKVHVVATRLDEAAACCERALEVSLKAEDQSAAARCLLTSCRIAAFQGRPAEALDTARRGLALAEAHRVPALVADGLGFIGYLLVTTQPDKLGEGSQRLEQALTVLAEVGDKISLLNIENLLGTALAMQGEFTRAREAFAHTEKLAFEVGSLDEELLAQLNLSLVAYAVGDYSDALALAATARERAETGTDFQRVLPAMLEGIAASRLGRLTHAQTLLNEALTTARRTAHHYIEAMVLRYDAELLSQLGNWQAVREVGERFRALDAADHGVSAEVDALVGEATAHLGDPVAGEALIDRAQAEAFAFHARGAQVLALRCKAQLAVQAGRFEEAAKAAERALGLAELSGMRPQLAALEGLRGEIALAIGRPAADNFQRMLDLADEGGDNATVAEALFGLAASAPYAPSAAGNAAEAAALLRDVAADLSEVDAELFLARPAFRRVLEGNYIGFSLPRAAASHPVAPGAGPLGMASGLWKL